MDRDECLVNVNIINDYLKQNLWMDFEFCKMTQGEIVLSGRIDELGEELIEISFVWPFMVSCLMGFTYEEGLFISLVQGEEARALNLKYHVEIGNHIFRLLIDEMGDSCFIIAKEIHVRVKERKI